MMDRNFKIIFCSFYTLLTICSSAQEVITGLENNVIVKEFYDHKGHLKKSVAADTLALPFIDDFSNSWVVPDQKLWTDRFVFINNSYPIFPPSAGVATFDALDQDGSIYPHSSEFPFQADFLTSRPINLELAPSDSIYLSFFYQPGGKGEHPELNDSLFLDFFSLNSGEWNNIWSMQGDAAQNDFKMVLIRIDQPEYLGKGFRFRFRNHASLFQGDQTADLKSNCDHWNIDYVKIDKNRSSKDSVLRDVAFIDPMLSLLKDYETVPWSHAGAAHSTQRRPYIQTLIMNNDSISRNIKTSLEIKNLNTQNITRTPVTSNDILSGDSIHFLFSYDHPFNFGVGDSGIFRITAILGTDAFDYKPNDTLVYTQVFADYYALDDGSSEAGYGLRGDGTKNASVAVRFNSYVADSLRAVDVYFNETFESLNLDYYFYLNVWTDNNGKPGNLITNQAGMRPAYSDSLNKFVRYYLNEPVKVSGIFYVGWQKTVDKLENIGFDVNRINNSRNFYTDNGEWKNSAFAGSLMIRPVLGKKTVTGVSPINEIKDSIIMVFPNPADRYLEIPYISIHSGDEMELQILDVTGRQILSICPAKYQLLTEDLSPGYYLIRILNHSKRIILTSKVVIYH
jgi:hypothetical protein